MKTDNGLAIACFAVVMSGAAALAIASDMTAPICKAAAEATPKDKFDFGCLEFWLNRYQGLAGNLITAGVAAVTLIWINHTLVATNRQTSAIASNSLRKRAEEVENEISVYNTFLALLFKNRVAYLDIRGDKTVAGLFAASRWSDSVAADTADMVEAVRRLWAGHIDPRRAHLEAAILNTATDLELYANIFGLEDAYKSRDSDFLKFNPGVDEDDLRVKDSFLKQSYSRMNELIEHLRDAEHYAKSDLNRIWRRIRAFEHDAVGQS